MTDTNESGSKSTGGNGEQPDVPTIKVHFIEAQLEKVSLEAGDVLIFTAPGMIPEKGLAVLKQLLQRYFPNNEHLILTGGAKIGVISKKSMIRLAR